MMEAGPPVNHSHVASKYPQSFTGIHTRLMKTLQQHTNTTNTSKLGWDWEQRRLLAMDATILQPEGATSAVDTELLH